MKSSFHDTKSSIYYEWPINSKFIMNVRSTLVSNSTSYLYRFTTSVLLQAFPRLKCIIDLTNTSRYYDEKVRQAQIILRRKKGVSKESKDISSLFANESLTAFLDRADIRERGSFTRSFRVSFSIYHLSLSLSFVRFFLLFLTTALYYVCVGLDFIWHLKLVESVQFVIA